MHKVISFGIPSYNAAKDMDHCITSILEGSNYATDIEIIIVDDGSKDETAAKADEWETRYPGIIRAVHQENGGHGLALLSGHLRRVRRKVPPHRQGHPSGERRPRHRRPFGLA